MTTILELDDLDAALILSPNSIEVHLPDAVLNASEDLGDGLLALDTDESNTHVAIIMALAALLDADEGFPDYVMNRLVEIAEEVLPRELKAT